MSSYNVLTDKDIKVKTDADNPHYWYKYWDTKKEFS